MWTALDIFIGLALCYALISLFCTAIQEFIAQALDSRGKLLVRALVSIDFEKLVEKLSTNFLANPGSLGSVLSPTKQKKSGDTNSKSSDTDSKSSDTDSTSSDTDSTSLVAAQKTNGNLVKVWLSKNWSSLTKATSVRAWFSQNLPTLTKFIQSRRPMTDPTPESLGKTISSGMGLIVDGKSELKLDTDINKLKIPDGLKARLLALSGAARDDVDKVKAEVEKWCGDFLAEVNHWFTRRAQIVSLLIGFGVALALNVDTIELATKLSNDPVLREAAVKAAGKLVADDKLKDCPDPTTDPSKRPGITGAAPTKPALELPKKDDATKGAETKPDKDANATLDSIKNCLASVQTTYPIPLGWQNVHAVKAVLDTPYSHTLDKRLDVLCAIFDAITLTKLIGLLLTAIALSLGSRYWFDTLKSLLALRTGGQPKAAAK